MIREWYEGCFVAKPFDEWMHRHGIHWACSLLGRMIGSWY